MMMKLKQSVAISALMVGAMAHPAWADLTAQEAWESLKGMMVGYAVTGDESQNGNTLTIDNLAFSTQLSGSDESMTLSLGSVSFVENGDGTVSMDIPASIPIAMTLNVEGDQKMTMNYDVKQTGASVVFSGSQDDLVQTYKADSLSVVIDNFDMPDEDIPSDFMNISMNMTGLSSESRITAGSPRPFSFTGTGASVSYEVKVDIPGDDNMSMTGQVSDLAMNGSGAMPDSAVSADLNQLIEAGYAMTGQATFGAGQMSISGKAEGSEFGMETQSGGGALDFSMDDGSIAYGLAQNGVAMTVTTSEFPVPIALEMLGYELGLTMPVQSGDEPQDFALRVSLSEFAASDMLWSMFDPTSVLPRDPATLLVDLAGKATVLANLLDETAVEEMAQAGQMPAMLNGLDIKGLQLKLAGADLQGSGAFTFDNSDTQSFGGMPRPTGALDLTLSGGNALLDKLVQLGFVGQQEAGGARMMMGLLAVSGEAPDTLKSKLEINDQGHISANGQRIQ